MREVGLIFSLSKIRTLRFVDRIGQALEFIDSSLPVEPIVYIPEEFDQLVLEKNAFVMSALEEGKILYEGVSYITERMPE
jgi:hypothetical protein